MDEPIRWLLTAIGAGLLLIGGGIAVGWRYFTKRQDEQHALLIAELNSNRERIEKIQQNAKEEREQSRKDMGVERDKADQQRLNSDTKVETLTQSFISTVKEISDAVKESTVTSNLNMEKVIHAIEALSQKEEPSKKRVRSTAQPKARKTQ